MNVFTASHKSSDRRWTLLLPAMFITYSLAYVDRVNYGFGAAAGMARDLHITSNQSAFLAAVFFAGYLIFQIPGAAYAQNKSAVRLIFLALLGWGSLATLTGIIRIYWMLVLDRFLLGASESIIMPAMLVLIMKWFSPEERSQANTILILGNPVTIVWMSALTGYLIQRWGWQTTFIIEGLPSILWAFVWITSIPDSPERTSWVKSEYSFIASDTIPPADIPFNEMLRTPTLMLLCLQFFFWSVGLYGLVLWLPTIIRGGTGSSMQQTGLLSAAPYLSASIAMLLVGRVGRAGRLQKFSVWLSLISSGAFMFLSFLTSRYDFWLAYLFLTIAAAGIYAPYGPFWAIVSEILPRRVIGKSIGLINCCGAFGGLIGSWVVGVLQTATGKPTVGLLIISTSLILSGVLTLFLANDPRPFTPLLLGVSDDRLSGRGAY